MAIIQILRLKLAIICKKLFKHTNSISMHFLNTVGIYLVVAYVVSANIGYASLEVYFHFKFLSKKSFSVAF